MSPRSMAIALVASQKDLEEENNYTAQSSSSDEEGEADAESENSR